eukprot:m.192279 g.192279  ORF g.192279 m.192279 type:complete len:77 (-) comp14851_c3_seq2:640-870(-)
MKNLMNLQIDTTTGREVRASAFLLMFRSPCFAAFALSSDTNKRITGSSGHHVSFDKQTVRVGYCQPVVNRKIRIKG